MILLVMLLTLTGLNEEKCNLASLRGGAWIPRLAGTILDGGTPIDLETNVSMHDAEKSPLVEFNLNPMNSISVSCSVFDFETKGSGAYSGIDNYGEASFVTGDSWNAHIAIQSVGFNASLNMIEPYPSSNNATLTFAPVIGMRWFGIESELRNNNTDNTATHRNSFIALQGGCNVEFRWHDAEEFWGANEITLQSELLLGSIFGGDGGAMWGVTAGIEAQMSNILGIYFGYRLQELDVEEGEYAFDAGLQGLYFGAQLQF